MLARSVAVATTAWRRRGGRKQASWQRERERPGGARREATGTPLLTLRLGEVRGVRGFGWAGQGWAGLGRLFCLAHGPRWARRAWLLVLPERQPRSSQHAEPASQPASQAGKKSQAGSQAGRRAKQAASKQGRKAAAAQASSGRADHAFPAGILGWHLGPAGLGLGSAGLRAGAWDHDHLTTTIHLTADPVHPLPAASSSPSLSLSPLSSPPFPLQPFARLLFSPRATSPHATADLREPPAAFASEPEPPPWVHSPSDPPRRLRTCFCAAQTQRSDRLARPHLQPIAAIRLCISASRLATYTHAHTTHRHHHDAHAPHTSSQSGRPTSVSHLRST
ncbi:uncharacterized protein PSFLO_04493 [Pseudozyma flocculosa]|uniref:Uncharacterized protein n=1 Tax=Pseudozyma flocculosa TaxID=84751 RepID=A0A5C3F3D3_9BASI|nr:uncharacterized protein PSFLO_04493 [Pseudozyma flocculosa]